MLVNAGIGTIILAKLLQCLTFGREYLILMSSKSSDINLGELNAMVPCYFKCDMFWHQFMQRIQWFRPPVHMPVIVNDGRADSFVVLNLPARI